MELDIALEEIMNKKLSTVFAFGFSLITFLIIFLIFIIANAGIGRQYKNHLQLQQKETADTISIGISHQYNPKNNQWNQDYIHGYGMYALKEGYIIKVYDTKNKVIWDAQHHDMTLCHQIMGKISKQMKEKSYLNHGGFKKYRYSITSHGKIIGYSEIRYYTPYSMNEYDFQFLHSLNLCLIFLGIAAMIAAGIAGWFLSKFLASPIEKVIETTQKIADGTYEIRINSNVPTLELKHLTTSVNRMAQFLENQEALRKRLVTDMAHELRTPLTNVSSYLELMADGIWEVTPKRLNTCYQELLRICTLIKRLDQLQNIEKENLKLSPKLTDIKSMIEKTCQAFESQLFEKQISCSIRGSHSFLFVDSSFFSQVLSNLLSNAIKYTEPNGSILWVIEETASDVLIKISDNGIGISSKDLPYIFERFYRADQSRQRKSGGSGIGLTITKAIVQAHHGSIWAESTPGCMTTFTIKLKKP